MNKTGAYTNAKHHRKLFGNLSRHYNRSGKEYCRLKYSIWLSLCQDELQLYCMQIEDMKIIDI